MFERKFIVKARRILGWPTALAAIAFIGAPFWPFGIPLASTAIAFAVALLYMFFALVGQSVYLNYDGTYKEPNRAHICILVPIIIALQGAQYSSIGALDGHAMVMVLFVLALAFLAWPVSMAIARKYEPIYKQTMRQKAERALCRALDNADMPATTRASIQARARGATTAELNKMAEAINTLGTLTPEVCT